ncbi:hypothetical protein ScPMuIL_012688 [Solemya velum]
MHEKPTGGLVVGLLLLVVLSTIACGVAVGFAVYNHNKSADNEEKIEQMKEVQSLSLGFMWEDRVTSMPPTDYGEFLNRVMEESIKQDRNSELGALSLKTQYAHWMGFGKEIVSHDRPGPCTKVFGADGGSEDLVILQNGLMFMTSGFLHPFEGRVLLYDFNKPNMTVLNVNIVKGPDSDFRADDFHPHGMSSWEENGQIYLYVLNHAKARDSVEMFQFDNSTQTITHLRNFTSPDFNFMNDLVMVSKLSFFITNFLRWRDPARIELEIRLMSHFGTILFYDGTKPSTTAATTVFRSLSMPNGINMSPDGKFIYVAEYGTMNLKVYKRNLLDNSLTEHDTRNTETAVDNIAVEPHTGDLWIGCHPILNKVHDYINSGATGISPSQVLRVKLNEGKIVELIETYVNDSREISASTSAAYYNGKMVITTLSDNHILVCDAVAID